MGWAGIGDRGVAEVDNGQLSMRLLMVLPPSPLPTHTHLVPSALLGTCTLGTCHLPACLLVPPGHHWGLPAACLPPPSPPTTHNSLTPPPGHHCPQLHPRQVPAEVP